jgi:flagellar M-ring protein FliF
MSFLNKIKAIWQNISLIQRAILTAILLTFIIVGVLFTHWARMPDMAMLYLELPPEEAAKITDKLAEKSITYELRDGGTSIYVPKEKVYQLRLDMAKEGLPAGEQGGYKIFDNEKIGISPFVQNVNLKRALQDELAKSIQMMNGVVYARVHIVSSEQTIFTSNSGATSASIVLKLQPGYRLSGLNVAAITHMVAGSVEGLKSENVTVVDSEGRLLTSESDQDQVHGAGTVADYKDRVEQGLAEKVEDMLTAVLGPGRATVKVSAVVDMTSTNLVTESYDPGKKVATKEEIKSNSETEPGSPGEEGAAPAPGGTKKDETIVTEYAVGKTVEQKVDLPGEIKFLKVAAVVDLSSPVSADANETQGTGEAEKIMKLSDVENLIKNALGLGENDTLTVVDAKFYQPEPLVDEEASGGIDFVKIAHHGSLGIAAICALLVLRIFGRAKKKAAAAAEAESGQLPGAGAPAGLLPAGVPESIVLRRQIAATLQNNPEQAKQLFQSWLAEKGG